MGRIARVLDYIKTTINGANTSRTVVDLSAGANITADQFSSAGDDSAPVNSDYAITVSIQRTGGAVVVGYLDPKNPKVSNKGERRLLGRSQEGDKVSEIYLKNDGTITLFNDSAQTTISPNGDIIGSNNNGSYEVNSGGVVTLSSNGATLVLNQSSLVSSVPIAAPSYTGSGGGAATMTAGIDMAGNSITNASDVVASGISLTGHTHGGVQSGGSSTGGPQ